MKAIILSAGQGTRLLPLTAERPKCLLAVRGQETLLELQLQTLAACGIRDISVVVGFGAAHVRRQLRRLRTRGLGRLRVRTLYNPLFDTADNLVSCWIARSEMRAPFVLLNGDTIFEAALLERLLAAPPAPVSLAVNRKASYDADDMKVSLDGPRLRAVGKTLPAEIVDAESVGVMVFRGEGPQAFRRALASALRQPGAERAWYLSAVDALARSGRVYGVPVSGLGCWEVDDAEDLARVRHALASSPASSARAARLRALAGAVVAAGARDRRPETGRLRCA